MLLTTIAQGELSRIVEPRRLVARTNDEWRALWALHAGPDSEAPAIDFNERTAAGAFGGEKPSAGYSVRIVDAREEGGGVHVLVSEQRPRRDTIAAAIVTYPFHIVSLPRVDAPIVWDAAAEPASPNQPLTGPDPRHPTPAPGAPLTSTGLSPRAGSALAYVAGPFSGVLMLMAERQNGDVRFHAWQSIVALGGLCLALVASYMLAFAALFVSTAAIRLMLDVATVIWIVFAIVWAMCVWKAFSGGRWRLPLAGAFAERLTSRRTS